MRHYLRIDGQMFSQKDNMVNVATLKELDFVSTSNLLNVSKYTRNNRMYSYNTPSRGFVSSIVPTTSKRKNTMAATNPSRFIVVYFCELGFIGVDMTCLWSF